MKRAMHYFLVCAWLAGVTLPCLGQISVSGITTKSYPGAGDQATFTVTPSAGYTYGAYLNGTPVPVGSANVVNKPDYYDLWVYATNTSTLAVTSNLTQFIVRAAERDSTECGLPPLTIYPPIPSAAAEFAGAQFRILLPERYPAGMELPMVIWIVDAEGHAVRVNGDVTITGNSPVGIKRGVGSAILPGSPAGTNIYTFQIAGLQTNKTVVFEAAPAWTYVGGTLSGAVTWPENSFIAITNNLNLTPGSSLTVGAGSIVRIGPVLSITNNNNCQITINGTVDRPVVFTPASSAQPWGTIVQHANQVNLVANGTIFTGSGGYGNCWFVGHSTGCSSGSSVFGNLGSHRGEQALFSLVGTNCNLTMVDSAAISLPGQFGHSYGSASSNTNGYRITLTRFLMHRVTTGGEYTGAQFNVNDSAFIECPDMSTNFVDGDNDGLYIVNASLGPHGFTNTLFGWTKDDGIDSGGDGPGMLNFQNCWFEAIAHEANSLSGIQSSSAHADKVVTHVNDVILNCGQALEAGYGAPTGKLDHCLVIDGMVGARYGDNYNWAYYGRMIATNCVFLNNHHDAWCMNFQDWTYRVSSTDIRSNFFTTPDPLFPANALWDAGAEAWRLAEFRGTPAAGAVGAGFATRTNRFKLAQATNSLPVRLSMFSTSAVSVAYTIRGDRAILTNGTLTFEPGRMVRWIEPQGLTPQNYEQVTVELSSPQGAELSGLALVSYEAILPIMSLAASGAPRDISQYATGVAITLNEAALAGTTVDFQVTGNRTGSTNGTLTIPVGATSATFYASTISSADNDFIQVSFRQPVKMTLASNAQLLFVRMPTTAALTNTLLIARGTNTQWRYYTLLAAPPAEWKTNSFDDSSWASGLAQLGYGETDEKTKVPSNGALTAYFRRSFVVADATVYTNLFLWLLRDDGGVVYLNGQEIFRSPNMPAAPTVITHTTTTLLNQNGENTVDTNTVSAATLRTGTNVLAVEIHQADSASSDLSFDCELWALPRPMPPTPLPVYYGRMNGTLTLAWSDTAFQLLTATNIAGPWTTNIVPGVFSQPPTNAQEYYQLRRP